jgi:hypothetical protein
MQASQQFTLSVAPSAGFTLSLAGGWRLNQAYCKVGLAINFSTMKAWTLGHAQTMPLAEYQLPAMGSGTNFNSYPIVGQAKSYGNPYTISGWNSNYGTQLYAGGLMWRDGLLWMSGKGFYAASGSFPSTVIKKFSLGSSAAIAETITIASRPCQAFGGGFIKGHPTDILVGCGGYESGQGSRSGPCWMKLDGTVLNEFGDFSGPKLEREKRTNNYSCPNDGWFVPPDGSIGYWFAGRIWGGGLYLGGKVCFWVDQGTGPINYSYQTETFGNTSARYLCKYGDGEHFGTYEPFPYATVAGSEISPDGSKVYLLLRDAWMTNGGWDPAPVLACFNVN